MFKIKHLLVILLALPTSCDEDRLQADSSISNKIKKHIIVELGQSNMEGRDGDVKNVDYPFTSNNGFYFDGENEYLISTVRGGAKKGSQSNYFAEKFFQLSGSKAIMLESSKGGSGLTVVSKPNPNNWSSSGNLRKDSEELIRLACDFYNEESPAAAIWCQGERDAFEMCSNDNYDYEKVSNGLQDVIDWWHNLYPKAPFIIYQTAQSKDPDVKKCFQKMIEIENKMVKKNDFVYMGFVQPDNFEDRFLLNDGLHWNYEGLKLAGESGAKTLFEILKRRTENSNSVF